MLAARRLTGWVALAGAALIAALQAAGPSTAVAAPAGVAHPQPVARAIGWSSVPHPARNLPAFPAYELVCWGNGDLSAQRSAACRALALAAINHAHAVEHVRPIRLPRNFWRLHAPEQLFVIANLERTSRGLPPVRGLTRQIDHWARTGARHNADPFARGWRLSSGAALNAWGSNWAADYNVLTADYSWMYLDGWGGSRSATSNIDCTSPSARGCWGHRDNILATFGHSRRLVGGAAAVAHGWSGFFNSYAELFGQFNGRAPRFVYTWRAARHAGAR